MRGSIHCHGLAKLKSDPEICELTELKFSKVFWLKKLSNQAEILILRIKNCQLNTGRLKKEMAHHLYRGRSSNMQTRTVRKQIDAIYVCVRSSKLPITLEKIS